MVIIDIVAIQILLMQCKCRDRTALYHIAMLHIYNDIKYKQIVFIIISLLDFNDFSLLIMQYKICNMNDFNFLIYKHKTNITSESSKCNCLISLHIVN